MAEIEYSKVGLKAGLEIHQQLEIGSKLFCNCPAYLRSDTPDIIIKRKLHKVAGEGGEVDSAAQYESVIDREFIYEGYKDSTCLLEYDETPPYPLNELALTEAIRIALLLNCEIYQTTQIMRKTVIDGSNTSGFQRTLLIAKNGYVETSFGKVRIDTIALEEDAARIVSKEEKKAVFRLDRLGIPLVEIMTAPDMNTPEQIKETALKLGEILRACKVKRGIGTIRQDVNISVKGHDRVEIKGFQEPRIMILTVDKEIERQLGEIKEGKTLGAVRKALDDGGSEFLRPMPGSARMYPETDLPLLKISRDRINQIKKNLPKMRTEIRDELKKKGLNDELIELVLDGKLEKFEYLISILPREGPLVAKMVTIWQNELASKFKKNSEEIGGILSEDKLALVLENVVQGKIKGEDVRAIMQKLVEGVSLENALKVEKVDDNALEEEIMKIVKEKPGLRANAYMGLVMAKLKGKVDAKKAMEILGRVAGKV